MGSGIPMPPHATSTALTSKDGVCCTSAIPAKDSFIVAIVRPASQDVCISQSRRDVYTHNRLRVLQSFKTDKASTRKMINSRLPSLMEP